ncbi:MAG: substrate-binding domain-containing protein, partial [bacterium]
MERRMLKEEILEKIRNGVWKPGERIPSERDLALEKKLARATVNRVLKELEEEGLLINVKGKGRFVRDFKERKRTMTIGVVFWDFVHSVHPVGIEILKGIEEVVVKEGYRLLIYTARHTPSLLPSKRTAFNVVPMERVDGLILGAQELANEEIERVASFLPVVGYNLDSSLKIPLVIADYAWVGYIGVEYLASLGRRRIALINAWETFPIARNLFEGYRLGLGRVGIPFSSSLVRTGYYDYDSGYLLMRTLLEERPDGVICGDDFIAVGAIKAIKDAGLSVPEDIAVVGCNDMAIAEMIEPALTTFHIDFHRMGTETARLLLLLLKAKELEERIIYIKPKLVVRKST